MNRPVYVITDAHKRYRIRAALVELLTPTALVGVIAVPLWAVASIPLGLLLHWHPLGIFVAVVVGSPVLINLVDLAAAHLGLPPLGWIASQALGRERRPITSKESDV